MCRFVDEYHMDGRYQACSCGKHLWSTHAQKVVSSANKLTDDSGSRVVWIDESPEKKENYLHYLSRGLQMSLLIAILIVNSRIGLSE